MTTPGAEFVGNLGAAPAAAYPTVLPVALLLTGRRCLVVGGGPAAAQKVRTLLDAGALVHVVAPRVTPELAQWVVAAPALSWSDRVFVPSDLDGVHLVVTATRRADVDGAVY